MLYKSFTIVMTVRLYGQYCKTISCVPYVRCKLKHTLRSIGTIFQ